MFTIACDKHRQESNEWFEKDRQEFPDSTERERFGRRLVAIATGPVEDDCPNCKTVSMIQM